MLTRIKKITDMSDTQLTFGALAAVIVIPAVIIVSSGGHEIPKGNICSSPMFGMSEQTPTRDVAIAATTATGFTPMNVEDAVNAATEMLGDKIGDNHIIACKSALPGDNRIATINDRNLGFR